MGNTSNHTHSHHHSHHTDNERNLVIACFLTITFMIVEVIGGILSSSLILMADAGHMLIDSSALIISLFAMRLARKPADHKRSYGYKRCQVIAAFLNSLTLLGTTVWIVIEAIKRLLYPEPVLQDMVIIFGIIGLVVNCVSTALLYKGAKDNINIRSTLIHIINDIQGYVGAIIAGIIISYTGWTQVDPIVSIIFVSLIFKSAWDIAKQSFHILMEGVPYNIDEKQVIAVLKNKIPQIIDAHHIHIWSISSEYLIMTAHVRIADLSTSHDITTRIKRLLKKHFNISHATIELELSKCSDNKK